ncbi:MAG: ISNCY family transposase [Chloroflexota bacterium]
MNRGRYHMSQRELQRVPVVEAVLAKQMTQIEAAESLGLSTRQVRRLERRVQAEGLSGLMHRSCGQPAHHRVAEGLRHRVLGLIRQKYSDFGPTLACEKLSEVEKIVLSDETLRQWMRAEGIFNGRRRLRPHRQWRERRACYGQMVQMDGSHHRWLESRGPEFVLMGYVDDATGRVYARFYPSEDRDAAFDSFGRYCRLYGIPQSVYLDKHTIYKSWGKPTLEDQLANRWPQTQFERALSELGVEVIHAHSPQAKGRVERLFRTFQDRLIKELRLAHIRTPEEANRFLKGFLARYNRRFSKAPRQPGNLHRPAPAGKMLNQVLCVKEPRVVTNDGTIQIDGQRLQLLPPGLRPLAKKGVLVTVSPKGKMRVLHEGRELSYRVLPVQARPKQAPPIEQLPRAGHGHTPVANHPWRQFERVQRLKNSRPSKPLNLLEPKGLKT